MKIIVDAFGGDNAPQQILLGCAQARESLGIDIVLAGDKARLEACAKELDLTQQLAKMEILPCGQLLTMEDEPTSVIREKSDSSMAVGLRALAQGQGDAFASAGNSGALVVGATTLVKRVRGVKRVSFAPIMPGMNGFFMLIDGGANVDCRPEMLLQFGVMGSAYMKNVMGIEKPRVALANVGTEEHKGDQLRQEAGFAESLPGHPLCGQPGGPGHPLQQGGRGGGRRLYRQHDFKALRGRGHGPDGQD